MKTSAAAEQAAKRLPRGGVGEVARSRFGDQLGVGAGGDADDVAVGRDDGGDREAERLGRGSSDSPETASGSDLSNGAARARSPAVSSASRSSAWHWDSR